MTKKTNGFQWRDETVTAEIPVNVPAVEHGKLTTKRVTFHYSFDPGDYLDEMQSAAVELAKENPDSKMEEAFKRLATKYVSAIEGDGLAGSLADRFATVWGVKLLTKAAVRSAEILWLRLQVTEAKIEGPLAHAES